MHLRSSFCDDFQLWPWLNIDYWPNVYLIHIWYKYTFDTSTQRKYST